MQGVRVRKAKLRRFMVAGLGLRDTTTSLIRYEEMHFVSSYDFCENYCLSKIYFKPLGMKLR